MFTATRTLYTSDVILDKAIDCWEDAFRGLFWNSPPTVFLDIDERFGIPFSTASEPVLDLTDKAIERAVHDLLSGIAGQVGHSDSFGLGQNQHTLVFRLHGFPKAQVDPCGQTCSRRMQTSIAFFENRLHVKYAIDRESVERIRLQGFRDVVR